MAEEFQIGQRVVQKDKSGVPIMKIVDISKYTITCVYLSNRVEFKDRAIEFDRSEIEPYEQGGPITPIF